MYAIDSGRLGESLSAFVERFGLRSRVTASVPGCARLRTLLGGADAANVRHHIPAAFEEVADWADGQARRVWVDRSARVICTYCEHDLYLELFASDEVFTQALEKARAFYQSH